MLFVIPVLGHAADQANVSGQQTNPQAGKQRPGHILPTYTGNMHSASARMTLRDPSVRYATGRQSYSSRRGQAWGISCVPYARQASGINVPGNAWQWWHNADGMYARGDRPEAGSILNFRSNTRMPLGHVAVVTRVVNPREIVVEQANWPSNGLRGAVTHDVAVVDVSEANNWSAVRVELGKKGEFGSVYPTYGFIYNRPDTGVVTASVSAPAPLPQINPVPSDLRPVSERPWQTYEEVAESPGSTRRIDLRMTMPVASSAR